jgi:hypothetical protein
MPTIDKSKVKGVHVQLDDGSVWNAQVNDDGTFTLLQQITPPDGQGQQGQGQQGQGQQSQQPQSQAPPPDPFQNLPSELQKLVKQIQQQKGGSQEAEKQPESNDEPPKVTDGVFRAQLSNVMTDNKFDRRLRGRTRGTLDMKALAKIPTLSRSVFTQKQARKGKQYNVVLAIDQSGSMHDNRKMKDGTYKTKSEVAAEITVFLKEQFEGLNLNVGVVGYDIHVRVIKELEDKIDNKTLYNKVNCHAGGTNDYEGLRRAYKMLDGAKEGNKILIMLSDGYPGDFENATCYDTDGHPEKKQLPKLNARVDYNQPQHLHKLAKSHKDVTSIGVGIFEGGWSIPENFLVKSLDELKPTIIKVLKKNIKRG